MRLVCIMGTNCRQVEDLLDEICVGDGTDSRFILTTSHPDETLDEVIEFAGKWSGDYGDEVDILEV